MDAGQEAEEAGAGRAGIKLNSSILFLAFIYWGFFLEKDKQRFILFWVALFKMAEYFYFLPQDLEQYQEEEWWDVPTIKKALLTMSVFWTLAWLSSWCKVPSWMVHNPEKLAGRPNLVGKQEQQQQVIMRDAEKAADEDSYCRF